MRFHTSLPVTHIEKTIQFYSVLFRTPPVKVKDDYAKFLPEILDLNISFHASESGPSALRNLHLGLEMPDQATLDETHARLSAAGLVDSARETSICCYANQDKFWVTDPDGYQWEIYVLLENTEQKLGKSTSCCAVGAPAVGGACC
jgi:catechol 2,3-dioxygenase-like lactoylglutathione lyase family enzyme